MRFFIIVGLMLAVADPLLAQTEDQNEEIVVNGDAATSLDVEYVAPGQAIFHMGPLYGVFLGEVPLDVGIHLKQADVSGKGVAHVAKWRKTPYSNTLICFREVGRNWGLLTSCSTLDGNQVSIPVDLGARRNAVFALVPVAIDPDTKAHKAWIAHPENTRVQLRCDQQENMASIFAIDGAGVITVASEAERVSYQALYCAR